MATRGQLVNNTSIPLIFMGGWSGHESLAIPLGFQHAWREWELEADRVAVAAVARAGWDPDGLAAYLARTQPETLTRSTLPPRASRLAALQQATADLARVATVPPGAFPRIQEELCPLAKQPERRRAPSLVRK
jgi:hypothetical protein